MKLFVAALLLTAATFAHAQSAQSQDNAPSAKDQQAIDAAKVAAEQWLALLDAGQYKASWEQSAELLRKAVSVAQWEQGIRGARLPVGVFQQRALKASKYTTTMPGAPQGQYVVLQYASRFADRANAVETVTPMLQADGKWRVSGYFIN